MRYEDVKTLVVFDKGNNEVARFPFDLKDGDHGLPRWVFGLEPKDANTPIADYFYLETDDNGAWGFTPAIGPSTCWTGKASSAAEAIKLCDEWCREMF